MLWCVSLASAAREVHDHTHDGSWCLHRIVDTNGTLLTSGYDALGDVVSTAHGQVDSSFNAVSALPLSGTGRDIVTLRGNGFDPVPSANNVTFGGSPAVVLSVDLSGRSMLVQVPWSAASGEIAVTVAGRTAFTWLPLRFDDFSDVSELDLNGSAAPAIAARHRAVLRITPAHANQAGSFFGLQPLTLAADGSFSTKFCFNLSASAGWGDEEGVGADGFVFVVQPIGSNVGSSGAGTGYTGIGSSLGIEFDTYNNGSGYADPNGNHVAVDLNGVFTSSPAATFSKRMNDGNDYYVWVDYDGAADHLEVRVSPQDARPSTPLLSGTLDLPAVLGTSDAFFGFTAATGSGYSNHDIVSWEVRSGYAPIDAAGYSP